MSSTTTPERPVQRVAFSSLTPNNLGTVRVLNSTLFPVKYSEKFYKDVLQPEVEDFCKIIYLNDVAVGNICCRLEEKHNETKLYLMTMGVLAPYRSRSVGSTALRHILDAARASEKPRISGVYLHVQLSNEDAKRFYERHGFSETGLEVGYYKKIEPRDAWILEYKLHPSSPEGDGAPVETQNDVPVAGGAEP